MANFLPLPDTQDQENPLSHNTSMAWFIPPKERVLWKGKDLANKKTAIEARGDIGLVFQYPEHQLFAASVYEDVAFGPRNLGFSSHEVEERVREALDQVNLSFDELRDVSPFELSGGQQRRVAFAGCARHAS